MADRRVHELARALYAGRIDRREFVRRAAALGVSATAAGLFLRGAAVARAQEATSLPGNAVLPPVVAQPCEGDACPFAGQTVTVIVNVAGENGPISGPIYEVRPEFEAATGATLEIVEVPGGDHFPRLIEDLTSGTGQYDASIAGAWWIGELVAGDFIVPLDDYYNDTSGRFPRWDIEQVQPGPRSLLRYGDRLYMVANDHDGQVMYYRRDLFEDPAHQQGFQDQFGRPLVIPTTWDEFRDAAQYFNGKDLNGDGQPDSGVTMHLKVGFQGMFHFMSYSAPFVIGPENPKLYWFDPNDMRPLVDSPGHLRALQSLKELSQYGPRDMFGWELGQSWDYFLRGQAALTFSWGDLGALAQETPETNPATGKSTVKGRTGTAQIPGTLGYYNVAAGAEVNTETPNLVGNTTGGSWAGVISKLSEVPEATYYLLALMATNEKSLVYAQRGWDGVDPGRFFHYLPPDGTADIEGYLRAGWDERDAREYTAAYFANFNNPQQFPYLRIPGTFEYWTALDIRTSEALTDQSTPEEALAALAEDFEAITDRFGREDQLASYKASLGL